MKFGYEGAIDGFFFLPFFQLFFSFSVFQRRVKKSSALAPNKPVEGYFKKEIKLPDAMEEVQDSDESQEL